MEETSTGPATILQFRQDIEGELRRHIREALDVALAEELAAALASNRHERTDQRRGYRNGSRERTITTSDGARTVSVPRGRIVAPPARRRNSTASCCLAMPVGHARSTTRSWAVIWAA